MGVLWWLTIPVFATGIAAFVMSRRSRAATPEQQQEGIDEMERFRAAMAKPMPKPED